MPSPLIKEMIIRRFTGNYLYIIHHSHVGYGVVSQPANLIKRVDQLMRIDKITFNHKPSRSVDVNISDFRFEEYVFKENIEYIIFEFRRVMELKIKEYYGCGLVCHMIFDSSNFNNEDVFRLSINDTQNWVYRNNIYQPQ